MAWKTERQSRRFGSGARHLRNHGYEVVILDALGSGGSPGTVSDVIHTWGVPANEPSGFRVR